MTPLGSRGSKRTFAGVVVLCIVLFCLPHGASAQGALVPNSNPRFNRGGDIIVLEDSQDYRSTWATNITDGEPTPGLQSLQFILTVTSGNSLFSTLPRMNDVGLLTFRPAADQFGSAQVSVQLKDDGTSTCVVSPQNAVCPGACVPTDCSTSSIVSFTITILPVNDCPTFDHLGDQTSDEDAGLVVIKSWARSISLGASNENTQRLTWSVENDNMPLFSVQPTIDWLPGTSSSADLRFRAAPHAFGRATLTIKTTDDGGLANGGCDSSNTVIISLTINPVNDPPTFQMGPTPVTVNEDAGPVTVSAWAKQLSAGATGEDAQTLSFTLQFADPAHAAIFRETPTIDSSGNLRFEALPNKNTFNLQVELFVQLNDNGGGGDLSRSCNPITSCNRVRIIITPVNDAPTFAPGTDIEVWEDLLNLAVPPSPATHSVPSWARSISPGSAEETVEGQTVTFSVTNNRATMFAVQPRVDATGTLSFTLAPDRNGAAAVTVVIVDSLGLTGTTQTFLINVVPSNDAPLFTLASSTLTVAEDSGSQSVSNFVTGIARGPTTAVDETTQFLTFTVTSSNPSLFSMQPSLSFVSEEAARLTYQVADNAFGDVTVSVTLRDDGGTANKGVDSLTRTFTISATPVNDAPTFTIPLTVLTVIEDQFSTTEFSRTDFLEHVSPGPNEEATQSTTVATSTSNPELFSTAPRIAGNVLTFRTAPDAFGEATVSVTVSDNVQPPLSTTRTFVIRILARNDRPAFTPGRDLLGTTLAECRSELACAYTFPAWATAVAAGPTNEAAQALVFNVLAGAHASLFVAMPAISPTTGTLTFSLRPFQNTATSGPLSLTVTLTDDGGQLNQGEDTFSSSFRLEVPAFVDAPGFEIAVPTVESLENQGIVTQQNFVTRITTGTTSTQTDNLRFIATPSDPLFFESAPTVSMESATSATLTYRSKADANGQCVVTLILENILTSRRTTKQFTIAVLAVNSRPTFTLAGDVVVLRGSGSYASQIVTAASAGPSEADQSYTFATTCSVTSFFKVPPAIDTAGMLRFELTETGTGTSLCNVVMRDNGGTARGGVDTSVVQSFFIRVGAVNHPPTFRAGPEVTVAEDSGVRLFRNWATEMNVGFGDSPAEQRLTFSVSCTPSTLLVANPTINSLDGTLTLTPAPDQFGRATCTVILSDSGPGNAPDRNASDPQMLSIVIAAVNDAPLFTAGGSVAVVEDAPPYSAVWATGISSGPPNEAAQTLRFELTTQSTSVFAVLPAISAAGVLSFSLLPDRSGSTSVTACLVDNGGTALDGVDRTCTTFMIAVVAVNDPPSFNLRNASVTIFEDAGTVRLSRLVENVVPGPDDELAEQSIADARVGYSSGSEASCSALFALRPTVSMPSGDVVLQTASDAHGDCSLNITVVDSPGASSSAILLVTVIPVNDAPTVTLGGDITVLQGGPLTTIGSWLKASPGPANEASQRLTVTITTPSSSLFDVQPQVDVASGNITFKLGANVVGSVALSIVVADDGGTLNGGVSTSAPVSAMIIVRAVNSAPSFGLATTRVTVLEDSGVTIFNSFVTSVSAGGPGDDAQTVSFELQASSPDMFILQPAIAANRSLTFSVAPDVFGNATVLIFARDNGGTRDGGVDRSPSQAFSIFVSPVNDRPSFAIGNTDIFVLEDSSIVVSPWAAAISAGPRENDIQTVSFFIHSAAGATQAVLSAKFTTLSVNASHFVVRPAPNFNGVEPVVVTARDDGGVDNGGQNEAAAEMRVHVLPVNDPPTFSLNGDVTVQMDSNETRVPRWMSDVAAGPSDEQGQSLTYFVTVTNPSLFSQLPAIRDLASGDLTFRVAPGSFGSTRIAVTVRDNGGRTNGGNDTAVQEATITVNRVNRAPSFTAMFDSLRISVTSTIVRPYVLNVTDDLPTNLVGFRVVTNDNPALFTIAPAVSPTGNVVFTTSTATGTARLLISAVDNEGAVSASRQLTITVVPAQVMTMVLAAEIDTFSLQQFREQIAALFEVAVERVIIMSYAAASVKVEYYIAGEEPPVPPALFVQRSANKGDIMYSRLPIESVSVAAVATPPPTNATSTNPATPSPSGGSTSAPTSPSPPGATSAPSQPPPEKSGGFFDSENRTVLIIIIAVGGGLLLIAIIAVVACVCFRCRKSSDDRAGAAAKDRMRSPPRRFGMYAPPPTTRVMYVESPMAPQYLQKSYYGGAVEHGDDAASYRTSSAAIFATPARFRDESGSEPFATTEPHTEHKRPSWVRPQDLMFGRPLEKDNITDDGSKFEV